MTVTIKSLTGGEVAGAGAFDELMRTVKANLTEEYDAERIVGGEYAEIFLGSINAALSTASAFILQVPTVNQQELLLQEQVIQAQKQNLILDQDLLKGIAETALVGKQEDLIDEQLLKVQAEVALISANKLIADLELTKMGLENDILVAQKSLSDQELTNLINTDLSITTAREKIDAEILVLNQKRYTEEAQVSDTYGTELAAVTGVIGKQKELYTNQAAGYIRDAE